MMPTLMVLYDDLLDRRYLQLFKYNEITKSVVPGDIILDHIEDDANLLIAVPAPIGGVLLVSGQYIRYLKPNHPPKAIGISSSSVINCHSIINNEGSRYLLGSTDGFLYLLVLNLDHTLQSVNSLGFIELGAISIPSCLTYLDNDVLYVGSSKGDSQLVHILQKNSIENNDILQVIENYPSLSPITDFCVVDLDKQGQSQLITCSGASKNSSLRIIRSGVGLNQLATIEISGVKDTWALRPSFEDKFSDILMMSFVNEARLIQLQDNNIVPLSHYSAFNLNQRTIIAGNMMNDIIIQVTEYSIRLMTCGLEGTLLDEWISPSPSSTITVASINPTQCVISIGFGHLLAFAIKNRRLTIIGETQLEQEISCIDITPIDPSIQPYASSIIAVGLWRQVGVRLLRFDSTLTCIAKEELPGMVTPRSILMTRLEDICYLIIALGDGQVYNFKLDSRQGHLWDKKRSFLGKLPIILSNFSSNGITHVFAASDKPSVIHSRNQKLVYSNVNLKDVRCATSFNSPYFPDAVALTTSDGVLIGQMEEIQKLHITKIPTLDTPRRIVYQETTHTFGVITEKMTSEPYTSQSTTGGFELLDDQNFILLDRIYFKQYERPLAAISMTYDQDEYYVLGTGRDSDTFESSSSGRILVLKVTTQHATSSSLTMASTEGKQKLVLVSQTRTQGMVEQLKVFKDKLIASVHGKLVFYEWKLHNNIPQLTMTCSHQLPSITESISIYGDYILIGDMLASVVAIKYDTSKQPPVIEEIAADEVVREVTSLEAISDTLAIGAERDGHIFVVERIPNSTNDVNYNINNTNTATISSLSSSANIPIEDPLLETVSEWNLGDLIQKFQFGSLGNIDPDLKSSTPTALSTSSSPTLLFATANGAIGIIADLTEERYKLLWHMQNNMIKIVKSIGGFKHTDWRSIATMERKEESSNFIDGDLIESFLDLTPQQMQQVIDGHNNGKRLDYSVEDLCKVVEELMSLHS
ncbi:unnamed protein product [Cunninghamella echinulata]